jgi:hypothetical protein
MSDTTTGTADALLKRISDLEAAVAKANSESKDRRKALRSEREAREKLESDLKALAADRDQWKTKAESSPDEWKTKAQEYQAKLQARDARDAWSGVVGDTLADKVTLEKLWAEIQYTPGEAAPTPEEITEQVRAARESAPYLFKPAGATPAAAPGGATRTPKPPLRELEGVGRGAPDTTASRVVVRQSQLQDPRWTLDPRNKKMIADAQANGTLEVVEG